MPVHNLEDFVVDALLPTDLIDQASSHILLSLAT